VMYVVCVLVASVLVKYLKLLARRDENTWSQVS